MLAKPTKAIGEVLDRFEGKEFTCEYKYDGERAQVRPGLLSYLNIGTDQIGASVGRWYGGCLQSEFGRYERKVS
jgi:hypothetical protein